ncbi:MAG: rhomboid family intramembrane serine protease [Nitrospiraceae bacterium]|nr:rhomboid family intramembrane serine protease [Nitrospiraceae bacterium]
MRREQWHLTEALLFLHFAFYFMTTTAPAKRILLALIPGAVGQRPWTLVTFQFLHGGMIGFFFSMLILWFMARPLEEEWGSLRFLIFWAISVFGAAGTALLFGQPLAGDIFLDTSLLFTYAVLSPDTEFLLFFILPVKVKWLAILGGGFLLFEAFTTYGLGGGLANAVGMSAGFVFFLATRRLPSRRTVAYKLKKAHVDLTAAAKETVVERRNLAWDRRVRELAARVAAGGELTDEDRTFLGELEAAKDPSVTICAPEEFGFAEDPVCRKCSGYPECALRRIRYPER